MCGHSRTAIYLSNLIITTIASLVCEIIFLLIVFFLGNLIYGNIEMQIFQFVMNILNTGLIILSFCSIYNFITMICSDITVSTTICIFLFIAMFILSASTQYALIDIQPTIKEYEINENGEQFVVDEKPNPNYPGSIKYNIMKAIYLLNPESQATEIQSRSTEYIYEMPIYSIGLTIVISIGGIWIFSKKQLK